MGKEYRARTFKSGNSIALRLPKALGIGQGMEMTVREQDGQLIVQPCRPERTTIDLTGIWGSIPGLKPVPRIEWEPHEADWEGKLLDRG